MKKVTLIFVKMGNSCPLHISSVLNQKQDMQFHRYLSRGTANVLAESVLLAMAKNVNKLHNKIQIFFKSNFGIVLKYGFFTKKLSF